MELNTQSMENFHCPRWGQLPTLPLYMDQVILVLKQAMGPFADEKERVLTASMVNNYVKQGLIAAPEKKRYANHHVAGLIMVSVLKKVLPMSELAAVLRLLVAAYGSQKTYDLFCQRLEEMLADAFGSPQQVVGPVTMQHEALDLLNAALAALMGHLLVQSTLAGMAQNLDENCAATAQKT